MEQGIIIALIGALGTVLGSLIVWLKKTQGMLIARISELELEVRKCHQSRLADSEKIGKLTQTVNQLQRMVAADNVGGPLLCRFRVDSSEKILAVQSNVEALLGFSAAELIGQRIDVLIPSDIRAAHAAAFRRRAADANIHSSALTLRDMKAVHKLGGFVPVRITLHEIHGVGGGKEFIADLRRIME